MRAQLDRLGLAYEFFRGVDASKGELAGISRYDERLALRKLGHPLTTAELGCFASHYLLWQQCVEAGEPLVAMEDDVLIAPAFTTALRLAAERIESRRFIRLAGIWESPYRRVEALADGHELVRYRKGPVGTQCYAVSPAGARALLDRADVWIDAVDKYVDAFWIHGVASFAIRPFHIGHDQHGTPASVVNETRSPYRRPLAAVLRRKLTHLGYRLRRIAFNLRHP